MLRLCLLAAVVVTTSYAGDCSASKDAGFACSTGSPQKFFYFDSRTKVCQPLFHKGCGGNDNKFASAAECKETCANGGSKKATGSSGSTEPASTLVLKSGHDQWTHATKCGAEHLIPDKEYIKCTNGGCPANHTCTGDVCCPSKDYVCHLPDDNGTFEDGIEDKPRFGWSDKWKTCVRFSYYGARGNYNNFPNFYSCQRFCNAGGAGGR